MELKGEDARILFPTHAIFIENEIGDICGDVTQIKPESRYCSTYSKDAMNRCIIFLREIPVIENTYEEIDKIEVENDGNQ